MDGKNLHIDLDQSSDGAVYLRIAGALRQRILDGALEPSERLPTTRALSRRLGVNRNTIVAAYRKLEDWHLARAHVGRGTFVLPAADRAALRPPEGTESAPGAPMPREIPGGRGAVRHAGSQPPAPWVGSFSRALEGSAAHSLAAAYPIDHEHRAISFAGSLPAPDLLPVEAFRRAIARVLKRDPLRAFAYGAAQGALPLREWIAAEMSGRGMPTSADEVLITNGSQQAIDLIARAFTDPGDLVLLENPTYSGAISTFQSFGARLAGLPLDEEGVLPGAIAGSASRGGAKLVYVTPSFQNPTSGVLSLARRREILSEAEAGNLLVVEDDWASGLRFEGKDLPTLRSLDREGRVVYLSTFAKKLLPGLRIGWIAAARPIIERLVVLKQINDCCTSPMVQAALEEFCRTGGLAKHLPIVGAAYRTRRDAMISALAHRMPRGTTWTHPEGGLFLWVRLPEGAQAHTVADEAERRGVLVSRGELFHLDGAGRNSLRLTFAATPPSKIADGIRILGSIVKKQVSSGARRADAPARESIPLV